LRVSRLLVDGLVLAPNGAHPTSCDPDYGRDEPFQAAYLATAKEAERWDAFRAEWLSFPTEADYQAALAARPTEEPAR
jgi:glutaconate CoA-transferase subunit A